MSTQNLQSAESRKINKSFLEGQSRVRYLTRDFLSVEGKARKGEALAGLPLSPPPLPRFPYRHIYAIDLTASSPLVILTRIIHKISKVRYKYHD